MNSNFSVMILAAGFGKRMLPLTKKIPKPLIDVNGITLLENLINFLKNLECNQIIINTHYQYLQIENVIKQNNYRENIITIFEKEILDTGGGVKNAIPYFINKNLLIVNCDVFWQNDNLEDIKLLIKNFQKDLHPRLLLVDKKNTYGLSKENGDFILEKNKVLRFKKGDKLIFYSGIQILNLDILDKFSNGNFSFNIIWDYLIEKKNAIWADDAI